MSELKEQRYIIEIAKVQGVAKAAENLFISQPALSKFLTRTEEMYGVQLFERIGKKMIPTYAGKQYLEYAKQIIKLDQDFRNQIADIKMLKTIGTTPRQLKRIIRQQALLLCVIGIPAGMLLGYGVGAVLTPVVMARTTFGAETTTISASPLIFLASALFALVTVLLSCSRPGKIASKVSPVEATKYTEIVRSKKKRRTTRGAKVYQMAFANLGRNKRKTVLVVISLSLSVVLLNILVTFTGGFDMEKYLAKQTCADFIVSSTDYFRYNRSESYISQEQMEQIEANTALSLSGCGYTLTGYTPYAWMSEEHWLQDMMHYTSEENAKAVVEQRDRRGDLVGESTLMEGLDDPLFDKLTVVEGDISPMFQKDKNTHLSPVDQIF